MNQLSAGYGAAGLAGYGTQYSMAGLGAGGWSQTFLFKIFFYFKQN